MFDSEQELRGALRSALDGAAPAPVTSLDEVLRRGRRRVYVKWTGAAACVVVAAIGFGVGVLALANAPKALPPAQTLTTTPTTSVRAQANWPRIDTPARTPSTTLNFPGMPPIRCAPTGTAGVTGWPGSSKVPDTVRVAWERALVEVAAPANVGPPQFHLATPRSPGERESYGYWANVEDQGSMWLRAGSFTGSPLAHADDQMWTTGDCVPPKRHVLANGTVLQLHSVVEAAPEPTFSQVLMIYTSAGTSYRITLSNHRGEYLLSPEFNSDHTARGARRALPLTEEQLVRIGVAVAEAMCTGGRTAGC